MSRGLGDVYKRQAWQIVSSVLMDGTVFRLRIFAIVEVESPDSAERR